jgi:hypothetical protein
MPAKKGSKYLNAKTSSILSQYNHEDMQKLLNSGEFKSIIARRLGVQSYCQMLCMPKIRQHIFSHLSYRY